VRRHLAVFQAAAFCCAALTGCHRQASRTALANDQSAAIDRLLESRMASQHIPGLAAAVIRNGVVVRRATLGLANLHSHARVSADTPFQIASTTKTFTATSVLLLVADDRLRLDERLGGLLDGLPSAWRDVTVRQLLSHTSGLPDIVRTPGRLDLIADSWEKALPMIAAAPLQFARGEKWAYTQTNYVLLAQIVQRLSGKSLEVFMAERIFAPLAMEHSFFAVPGETSRSHAANYEPGEGGTPVLRSLDFPQFVHAAGGLCVSLDDFIRWNLALDAGKVLPAALATEMWTATPLNDGKPYRIDRRTTGYGLGWVVDDTPGRRCVGHSGGDSTAYRRYLDEGFTIIVLHNGVADPDELVAELASIVRRGEGGAAAPAQERLWDAAKTGDTAGIEKALGDGADIEALDTRKSRSGRRALNWAAWFDHPDAIRLLLKHGANIDAENATGFTALQHAAESGSLGAADALLAAGADANHRNAAGSRAADIARSQGHPEVAARIDAKAVVRSP
jgi:D-alanyl-D-alanine carboxypeptidase